MASAFEKLKLMTAAEKEPALTNGELEALLDLFATEDAAGASPKDPEWVPTYKLRAAAAEGWRWKAGRAAEAVSTDLDGDRMSANQLFEHCTRMVKRYASSVSVSVGVVTEEE